MESADDPQDFTFTLFFAGGQYELPVHLEGRVSRSFNISEIIDNQIPDPEGHTIPVTIQEGSAEVAGSKGVNQHILVAMAAGTYNVVKATCVWHCITCQGATHATVTSAIVLVGQSATLSFTIYNHDGSQFDDTSSAAWSSSNGSVATVGYGGLVNGVSAGTATISANDSQVQDYDSKLCTYGDYPDCGSVVGKGASGTVTVQVPTPTSVLVIGTISSGPKNNCAAGTQGWQRVVTNQLLDQHGNYYRHSGSVQDSITIGSRNDLYITQILTGPGTANANGSWPDTYSDCSAVCPASTGETDASQSWTYNGVTLPHVNALVACRGEFVSMASRGGEVRIFPIEWSRSFRVGADVANELAREITNRTKYAACDDISLDAREPSLDLIEPG